MRADAGGCASFPSLDLSESTTLLKSLAGLGPTPLFFPVEKIRSVGPGGVKGIRVLYTALLCSNTGRRPNKFGLAWPCIALHVIYEH